MPSDDSTVATQADFVPMAVGNTERGRSVSSVLAHDGTSPRPRPEVHETHPNVLSLYISIRSPHEQVLRVPILSIYLCLL